MPGFLADSNHQSDSDVQRHKHRDMTPPSGHKVKQCHDDKKKNLLEWNPFDCIIFILSLLLLLMVYALTSSSSPSRCDLCCLSFRTHRGLLRHNAAVHKVLPQDPSGRPFIQNNPSIPTGFNDLAFIDFSCKKFAHIAQVMSQTHGPRLF